MKKIRAADKSNAGGDEKHDINFHWPELDILSRLERHMYSTKQLDVFNKAT